MHGRLEDFDMPAPEQVERVAAALKILADPTRIRILWALQQGETNVACLAELARTTPTAVSQHLSKLRLAGLVHSRRQGAFVYYAVADDHVAVLLAEALSHTGYTLDGERVRSVRVR